MLTCYFVIIYDKYTHLIRLKFYICKVTAVLLTVCKSNGNIECCSFAFPAFYVDISVHHIYNSFGYCHSETGASVFTCV